MIARIKDHTQRLEEKTSELDRAHRQTHTSFAIAQEIGALTHLSDVCKYLIKSLRGIVTCKECGLPFRGRLERGRPELVCPGCGHSRTLDHSAWTAKAIAACPVCRCKHLYRQRDVNRALGCLLVAIGAVLVPWTYGISLVILAGVDLVLYLRLSESVVCYRCDTVFRDAVPGSRQGDFDLLKHDVLKYGKTWQEVDVDAAGGKPAPD